MVEEELSNVSQQQKSQFIPSTVVRFFVCFFSRLLIVCSSHSQWKIKTSPKSFRYLVRYLLRSLIGLSCGGRGLNWQSVWRNSVFSKSTSPSTVSQGAEVQKWQPVSSCYFCPRRQVNHTHLPCRQDQLNLLQKISVRFARFVKEVGNLSFLS